MKRQYPSKKILLFCLILATFQTFAQEKPQALKFDEFEDASKRPAYTYDEITLPERVERFAKQLKKERTARAYIIYYQARVIEGEEERENSYRIRRISDEVQYKSRLQSENIVIIDGGYREERTIEFWIAPKNAAPPAPTPTLTKSEIVNCRDIFINSDTPRGENETLSFSIPSQQLKELNDYSLTWKVSAGEIVSGQGTDKITVKLKDSSLKRVTAFVEVGGLSYQCRRVFPATVEFGGKLITVDNFGPISNGDLKTRLDSFLIELQNNPTAKGYIIIYGNRTEGNKSIERWITIINNHIRLRNYEVNRITFVRGGFREYLSSEIWLSFDDAVKPTPTPTVDKKFVEVPKQLRKPNRRKQ